MAQEIIFHKYHGLETDYLIYDINKNPMELNASMIHKIHNRSFGVDLGGILVGPFFQDGRLRVKQYDSNGAETKTGNRGMHLFAKYLKDEGYEKKDGLDTAGKGCTEDMGEYHPSKIYCWC